MEIWVIEDDKETFELLFKSLKEDMKNGFNIISAAIGEIKKELDHHINKSENDTGDIKLLMNNLDIALFEFVAK